MKNKKTIVFVGEEGEDAMVIYFDGLNKNNQECGNPETFRLEIVEKEIIVNTLNKKKKPTKAKAVVGRALLYVVKHGAERIIHKIDIPLSPKHNERLMTDWESELMRQFLYDAVGLFCLSVNQMVETRQKAAFDNINNRVEVDTLYKNKRITILRVDEDSWYKVGEEYDVFTRTDSNWAVFSDLPQHIQNNGIGLVKTIHAKVEDVPEVC